jgi:hypothetical protein
MAKLGKILYKINEWAKSSENLDLRRFFNKLLRKNIKFIYLGAGKNSIKDGLLALWPYIDKNR